ncbi:MAG TPA: type II toxin-antitoxin system VapC family toxin [Candidatus Angelobacter sp.]|nr:type II toxin-antitoxin system VapC family toxin [Candidatus Angelobacter sp.]
MPPRYLLDTNTASYVIKGNIPAVRLRLAQIPMAQVHISSITEAELRYGAARRPEASKLQQIIEEFLIRVTILSWDSQAAREYGVLRAALERSGQPFGNLDLMIAAHALATAAILVTNDRSFARVKKLKTENWAI